MTESKQIESVDERKYNADIKIDVQGLDFLIGKVFLHTELLGLTDRQLTAYRATLRQMCWDWYNSHMENAMGYADPSKQARVEAGIDQHVSHT